MYSMNLTSHLDKKTHKKKNKKKTCCQETFFCCSNEATVYKAMFRFTQQLSKFGRRSHLKFFQRGRGVETKTSHEAMRWNAKKSAEERRNLEKCCPKHQKVSLETQKVKQNRQTSLCWKHNDNKCRRYFNNIEFRRCQTLWDFCIKQTIWRLTTLSSGSVFLWNLLFCVRVLPWIALL